ncbi:multidrug effflux MFS transporter [Leisingera sp. ANG59]|uniref:multidrug effflux MFS transporter n=1 Tax=Leisingera sp. ANG59 TaxID=2675221 RepID=UPI001571F2EA|nr:multidrug effflux MFS transporter [Leisingera sp. ANG59]NSY39378.1 MFS transporter [Leisingera sp. ANG59]
MMQAPDSKATRGGWIDGPFFVLFIAGLMSSLALSLDIFLPVLPEISTAYQLEDSTQIRSILTVFIFSFGVGHLFAGILSDRYGRRPVLTGMLGLYAVMAVFCSVAPTFDALVLGRLVQGFAAAGPRVIAVAIVRDLRSGTEMARTLSIVMMFFMVAPILAPFLGEITSAIAGWRAVFAVLAIFALPLWAVVQFILPETCPPENRARIRANVIFGNLGRMIRAPQTLGNTAVATLIYGAMFGFIGIAPLIYGEIYGITTGFAAYFATFGMGIAGAAYANSKLVVRYGPTRVLLRALVCLTVIAIGFTVITQFIAPPLWLFHLTTMALMFTKGLIYANCNTLAVDLHRGFAGFASAMIGGMTMLGSAVIAHMIGGAYSGNVTILGASYALIGALATLIALQANCEL